MTDEEVWSLVTTEDMQRRAALGASGRLVHYTSAESAYRILTGKKVWLRSAAMMNDFSEVTHGLACLRSAWGSPGGLALQAMLDRLRPGLTVELQELFDSRAQALAHDTYLISLSEHEDSEDYLGRLSMWRAYGGNAGVALVLNPAVFSSATDVMKAYSAPVSYLDEGSFVSWFHL